MPEHMTKQDAIEYLLYTKHDVQAKSHMDIALDTAIEALKQPAVNRWISVEDALPDDRKCVLVTDGEDIEITFFDGSDWEMRDQYGNHYEIYGAVTHWMPLPKPPKEDET